MRLAIDVLVRHRRRFAALVDLPIEAAMLGIPKALLQEGEAFGGEAVAFGGCTSALLQPRQEPQDARLFDQALRRRALPGAALVMMQTVTATLRIAQAREPERYDILQENTLDRRTGFGHRADGLPGHGASGGCDGRFPYDCKGRLGKSEPGSDPLRRIERRLGGAGMRLEAVRD